MLLQVVFVAIIIHIVHSLPTREQRLSLAQWGSYNFRDHKGPGTYAFGYDIEDPSTDNVQYRQEERHANGTVTGSYGYVQPDGHVRIMHYIADHLGYRVQEENRPPQSFHPHHEPPSQQIPTTPSPPVHEDDEQIFEGEFYPVLDPVNNLDDDYNLDDANRQPIQFPPIVARPPVYVEDFGRPKYPPLKSSYALSPKPQLLKQKPPPKKVSPYFWNNNLRQKSGNNLQKKLLDGPNIKRISQDRPTAVLVYADPWGSYQSTVNFQVGK